MYSGLTDHAIDATDHALHKASESTTAVPGHGVRSLRPITLPISADKAMAAATPKLSERA